MVEKVNDVIVDRCMVPRTTELTAIERYLDESLLFLEIDSCIGS